MKKTKKAALVALAGTMMAFGGCIGGWWQAAIAGLPGTIIAEFLLDNDSIFDLFEDGGTAAQ